MSRWLPDEGSPVRTVDSGASWHVCLLDDGRYQAQVLLVGRCVLHCGEAEVVALRVEADERGLEIDVYADPGCVPSEDERDQYGKPECITFLRGVRQRAIDLDIDTVVVWWGGTGIGFVERGVAHDFCASESASISRDRLRRLIGYFDDVVDTVVLVAPVPRTDIGVADAAGTECEIVAYRDVATELSVPVVSLRDFVCPSYPDDCARIERYDGLHYDGEAARAVAGVILDAT